MFKFKGIPFGMRSAINTDFLGIIYEPKSEPPTYQVRVGPLSKKMKATGLAICLLLLPQTVSADPGIRKRILTCLQDAESTRDLITKEKELEIAWQGQITDSNVWTNKVCVNDKSVDCEVARDFTAALKKEISKEKLENRSLIILGTILNNGCVGWFAEMGVPLDQLDIGSLD